MEFTAFEITLIVLSLAYAVHGLIHQLVVGGAISIYPGMNEKQTRLILMSWIATGAFMSFLGFIPAILIFFFHAYSPVMKSLLLLETIALLFLGIHIYLSGHSTHPKPVRIGMIMSFVLAIAFGSFLVTGML